MTSCEAHEALPNLIGFSCGAWILKGQSLVIFDCSLMTDTTDVFDRNSSAGSREPPAQLSDNQPSFIMSQARHQCYSDIQPTVDLLTTVLMYR
jgi:hypothetical protein